MYRKLVLSLKTQNLATRSVPRFLVEPEGGTRTQTLAGQPRRQNKERSKQQLSRKPLLQAQKPKCGRNGQLIRRLLLQDRAPRCGRNELLIRRMLLQAGALKCGKRELLLRSLKRKIQPQRRPPKRKLLKNRRKVVRKKPRKAKTHVLPMPQRVQLLLSQSRRSMTISLS